MDYRVVTECRICGERDFKNYLGLGAVPLANTLIDNKDRRVNTYPLSVLFCKCCYLSQLSISVNPELMFTDYPYHSSISQTFKDHCYEMGVECMDILKSLGREKCASVIDIAANDGCLLDEFKRAGFSWTIAIEPAQNLAKECKEKGHQTHAGYWEDALAPRATVITATNVLAHVDDVKGFVSKISDQLSNVVNSFCVVEFPHLLSLFEKGAYDTMYHEHLSYFLLKPIKTLFSMCGMRVFDVKRTSIHGGSLRVYACLDYFLDWEKKEGGKDYDTYSRGPKYIHSSSVFPERESVNQIEKLEAESGLYCQLSYTDFGDLVKGSKQKLMDVLNSVKDKKVMGYGASAKGSTLMSYCGITSEHISSIVDETPQKQNKLTSHGIPIVPFDAFEREKPDYIVLLAWNFADELIEKTKHLGAKYIIPIPEVKIV